MLASIDRLFSIEAQRHFLDGPFMLYAVERFRNQWKDMPMASWLFPFCGSPRVEVIEWRYLIVRYLDWLVAVQKQKQARESDVLWNLSTYLSAQVRQQDGLGLNIKDFMLHVGSFNPGLLAQWSIMPGNQELANPQRQELPAAATSPATELLPNSIMRALPQQQPSVLPATQPVAAMPTAATGGTLDVLPSHDLSGPSVSRLMKQVRERQGRLGLQVKGSTMPAPALPTAASLQIGPGDGQPISAPQKGRQTVTQTELPSSTQPKLPLSTQSGAVHSSPMNQITHNDPARSQTHFKPGPGTEPPQARQQDPQQHSEAAADTAMHPVSSPRASPLSPVHPLSSPRGSPLSPGHPLSSPRGSALSADSARRQWLLTDSFRQRQATCKEALKAAQQDILRWLRTQRVAKFLPARGKFGCESCTSDAWEKSLAKYQEEYIDSPKTDHYLGVVANLRQVILLTECEDSMQTDSCSSALQHLQCGLQQFGAEGLDGPLEQPGHFDERLLMQEFYTALQAAAAVGGPSPAEGVPPLSAGRGVPVDPWGHVPLVLHRAKGKVSVALFSELTDAERGAAQTVQQLLQSSSNIYVNPAYESWCTRKAQEAMQAAGLLQNHKQGKHQAWLLRLLENRSAHAPLSGSDASLAGKKQDLNDVQAHAHSSDSAAPNSAQQADSEPEHDSDDQYAACTAGNINRMLLCKRHLRGLYALEHELEARRKSLGQLKFNSVVLGSYILAQSHPRDDGNKGTKPAEDCLHRIRAVHSCPVNSLVFETMHGESVPLCCLSDSAGCSEAQVLLEQGRLLKSSGQARLTRQEVAHADAAWRVSLCEQYFVIWDELQQPDLTPEQMGSIRDRLELKARETQSRPPQSVFDAIDTDYKTQEQSSRERLASLGIQVSRIPDSDSHPHIPLAEAPANPMSVPGPIDQSKQQNLDAAGGAPGPDLAVKPACTSASDATAEATRPAPAEQDEADLGCMVPTAGSEVMERIMLWQITNLHHWGCATYLNGASLFHRLTEHCIALSTAGETVITNVTIETIGWWGYVEFGSDAIRAQTDAASLLVDGYTIQLSVPTVPAPAYAAAAQACPASTVEESKRPQYIYASDAQTHAAAVAIAGPVQGQYPAYSYPAYGYDPSYGYSGYPVQWQPGQPGQDPVSQQYLYSHQAQYQALYAAPAQFPISLQTEASEQPAPGVGLEPSSEPTAELVRQVVPIAQPVAEPEELHAPEINAQQVAAAIGIAGPSVNIVVASPKLPRATPLKRKFIDSFRSDAPTKPVPLPKTTAALVAPPARHPSKLPAKFTISLADTADANQSDLPDGGSVSARVYSPQSEAATQLPQAVLGSIKGQTVAQAEGSVKGSMESDPPSSYPPPTLGLAAKRDTGPTAKHGAPAPLHDSAAGQPGPSDPRLARKRQREDSRSDMSPDRDEQNPTGNIVESGFPAAPPPYRPWGHPWGSTPPSGLWGKRYGEDSRVKGMFNVKARTWSAKRMGRLASESGVRAQFAEAMLPHQLIMTKLGIAFSPSADKWQQGLRDYWAGSLIVLTAHQDPSELEASLVSQLELARLSSMLRQSKQPLMTALSLSSTSSHDSDTQSDVPCDVSGAGAQLWLIAPNNVTRKIVCDYLTEGAKRVVEELLNMDNMSEMQKGRDRCNHILGLVFFRKG
ncbi:hypothetical protein WJX79_000069 [Trebouxia sp. C0005]